MWCLDSSTSQLYSSHLASDSPAFDSFSLRSLLPPNTPTPTALAPAPVAEEVWLHTDHTQWLLRLQDDDVSIVVNVEVGLSVVGVCDGGGESDGEAWPVWVERGTDHTLSLNYFEQQKVQVRKVYGTEEDRGNPVQVSGVVMCGPDVTRLLGQGSVLLCSKKDRLPLFRAALVMEDDSILMFESGLSESSQLVWAREDGLGSISSVQFLDLPADQSALVEDFLEKTMTEVNPIKLAVLRWQLQAQLFKVCLRDSGPVLGSFGVT